MSKKELNSVDLITEIIPKLDEVKKLQHKSIKESVKKGTATKKPTAATIKTVQKKPITKQIMETDENTGKPQASMYIDFPPSQVKTSPSQVQTSQNKPTKISIIIQLVGLLEALTPNRELLRSFMKLIKVFISVAFTLSAIYASCRIYATIFEWLVDFFKKGLKWSLESASSYLPEISNNLLIQKVLSFLLGAEVPPPINTYKYLPDFVYDMWLATKVLWSQPIFKFFLWALVGFVVLRKIFHFIAYAATLPGSWAKKITGAFGAYVQAFFRRCAHFFLFILELFRGMAKPGTGWLSFFWLFENMKDKAVLGSVKHGLENVLYRLNSLSEINDFLETVHEAAPGEDNLFYNRHRIQSHVSAGSEYITQFKNELLALRYLVEKLNNPETLLKYSTRLTRAEKMLQDLETNFNHWAGLLGEFEFNRRPESKDDEKNKSVFDFSPDDKNKTKRVPEDDKRKPKPASNPENVDLEEADDTEGKKR